MSKSKPPAKTGHGQSEKGLREAIENAFDDLGPDYEEAVVDKIHVSAGHHSPSHITQWKVEVRG